MYGLDGVNRIFYYPFLSLFISRGVDRIEPPVNVTSEVRICIRWPHFYFNPNTLRRKESGSREAGQSPGIGLSANFFPDQNSGRNGIRWAIDRQFDLLRGEFISGTHVNLDRCGGVPSMRLRPDVFTMGPRWGSRQYATARWREDEPRFWCAWRKAHGGGKVDIHIWRSECVQEGV